MQPPRVVGRVHAAMCLGQTPHTGQLWGDPGPQGCPVGGIQPNRPSSEIMPSVLSLWGSQAGA